MNDPVEIKCDYSEFSKALTEYMKVSKLSTAQALNRCAKNICVQAIKHTKVADKSKIKAMATDEKFLWWMMWTIKRKHDGYAKGMAKMGTVVKQGKSDGETKSEAMAKAKAIMSRKLSAVGFIRGFFSTLSKTIDGKGSGKSFAGIIPTFSPASSELQQAVLGVKYDFKSKKGSNKTSIPTEKILETSLQTGIDFAVKDMQTYIYKKLQEAGSKSGAK